MNDGAGVEADQGNSASVHGLVFVRLGIGLAQGIAAWLLLELLPTVGMGPERPNLMQWWPYRHPAVFAALALVTAFMPVVALAETGRMRGWRLGIYLPVLAGLIAGLAGYDHWRDPVAHGWSGDDIRIWPSMSLILCAGIGVFIINQLLEHHERAKSLWVDYADHFEDSWMRAFQFVLAMVFTLLVWGVLELGRALFDLIHLDGFGLMIEHNWFRCPVLAMAFAASVHITDVRPALLNGMRNLGLTLLSWLLPLVVALGWSFLAAVLMFTGLASLWGTRFAASILLWAVAITLLLVNAAYKDGNAANLPPAVIRWAGRAAGPMMLMLTLLAAYAIAQRVWQHGWTPQRLLSTMVAAIALVYATGYSRAAIAKNGWLRAIEPVNVAASLGILAVLVLILTPLADPARVAVNSQVARLASGKLAPGAFDYQFLRYNAGRYGGNALLALTHSANGDVASRARLALAAKNRVYLAPNSMPDPAETELPLAHAAIYPRGATLPDSFRRTKWGSDDYMTPACLGDGTPCDIIVLPHDAAHAPLLLILKAMPDKPAPTNAAPLKVFSEDPVYGQDASGQWSRIGIFAKAGCPGLREALRRGDAAAMRPMYDDLRLGDLRLTFVPATDSGCPARPAPAKAPSPGTPTDPRAPAGMGPAFGRAGGL